MGQQYSHLSSEERILIEKLHCEQHLSVRKIAEEIGRDKSTVSRELRRGLWFASNENGSYRPYRPKRLKTGPWTSGPFYSAVFRQLTKYSRIERTRGPRPGLQPFRPVGTVRPVLVGREPQAAPQLA